MEWVEQEGIIRRRRDEILRRGGGAEQQQQREVIAGVGVVHNYDACIDGVCDYFYANL